MATSPQRAYRAACPNCGAPVEFVSAASASAVCSFCRSTLVRDGEALRRIGVSAELFDDHSPLQLGAAGHYQGVPFTLVGRLQYGYGDGTWNEWHALFDGGRSGWLSEDNGAYVFAFDVALPADAPPPERLRAGEAVRVDGRAWSVASAVQARLIAAQGELPTPPRLQGEFLVVDLRNTQDEVGTLDYSDPQRPHWSVGRAVALSELALIGLREIQDKTLDARAFDCPGCGNALEVKLASTQSVTCDSCRAVVDISQGVGGELRHFAQNNSGEGGLEPQIPLGKVGQLRFGGEQAEPWQVVGYMERCDLPEAGSDDEQTYWREYLLYNRTGGFVFLVDSEDGWSWVKPLTGTPQVRADHATWRGDTYRQRWRYRAKVTWVQGEFYWTVRRDEVAVVTDYEGSGVAAKKRLSSEKTARELTWSGGETLDASVVARAFALSPDAQRRLRRDAAPLSTDTTRRSVGSPKVVIILFMVLVLLSILSECTDNDCSDVRQTFGEASAEYRQCVRNSGSGGSRGGSFGGFSSGGGHK